MGGGAGDALEAQEVAIALRLVEEKKRASEGADAWRGSSLQRKRPAIRLRVQKKRGGNKCNAAVRT